MATNTPVTEQHRRAVAARWVARLQAGDCTGAERAACLRWREEDEANDAAFAQMEAVHWHSAAFDLDPEQRAYVTSIRDRTARRAWQRRAGRWGIGLATAAVLVLAIGIGWRSWDPVQAERSYASTVGEQRSFVLDDGSTMLLDTDSRARIRFSRLRRKVVLERGRAQFAVAKAPERPFVVEAGMAKVRAVGTLFQVRRYADAVQVDLLEGVVEVTASDAGTDGRALTARLEAGEQISLDTRGQWRKQHLDREVVEGWTRGELVFRETPLPQLVAEMNRYTRVKLRLDDPGLADIRLSGVFYGSDQDSLVDALQQVWSLRVERKGDEIVIRR